MRHHDTNVTMSGTILLLPFLTTIGDFLKSPDHQNSQSFRLQLIEALLFFLYSYVVLEVVEFILIENNIRFGLCVW